MPKERVITCHKNLTTISLNFILSQPKIKKKINGLQRLQLNPHNPIRQSHLLACRKDRNTEF